MYTVLPSSVPELEGVGDNAVTKIIYNNSAFHLAFPEDSSLDLLMGNLNKGTNFTVGSNLCSLRAGSLPLKDHNMFLGFHLSLVSEALCGGCM